MLGQNHRYLLLKQEILNAATGTSFSLDRIKEHFAAKINSKRALDRVKNLHSFMCLLEERDLINCRQISYLKELAELLQNEKMKELLHTFKKLYLDGIEELCICGAITNFQPDNFPHSQQQENRCFSENNNHITPGLTQALQNISDGIGKHWVVLARVLDIKEGNIEQIRATYPNCQEQALAALKLWLRKEKENATIEVLDKALNSKDCARFGLGSFLLESRILLV